MCSKVLRDSCAKYKSSGAAIFHLVFVLAIVATCVEYVSAFNLDSKNFAKYGGHSGSMFGFSVATHRVNGRSLVLVGAPEAQSRQPNVESGGAVMRCQWDVENGCDEVPFDTRGPNVDNKSHYPIDNKSKQWFGATLRSAGEDGPVVACAPRYVYFGTNGNRRDPVGTCYVASPDLNSYSEYSPCRTKFFGYHRQGSCQAGFSAALSKDGDRLFLGAPGSYYWQGQVFSIDAHATFPYIPATILGAYGSGQVIQQGLERRPPVVSTHEGYLMDDDSYLGYSMTMGNFLGDGEQGVAVGKPRGARLLGQINMFTWNLTNYQNITLEEYGGQIGTYFGYCIISADVDGDLTDDLIVGAPLHTEANNEGKYEVGRVYVIFQGKDPKNRFRRYNSIDGFNSKSRFGLSLASLGDVNMDGFDDFAVGAPYDGPHERGAVYIYHGSKSFVDAKYSQVIYAEDVTEGLPIRTFGFSIGGGIDLDQNGYPDMAVGAYLSDTAFLFRARPIVKIESSVNFMNRNKKIVLEERNCTLRRQPVACAKINICTRFHGKAVPTTIDLEVQYILDGKKSKDPRMFFMSTEENTTVYENIRLYKDDKMQCRDKLVYIKNDIRDKLTTLDVEVRYTMRDAESQYQSQRDPRKQLHAILDANNKQMNKDSLTIHKNCGSDNICIPNLKLEVNSKVERFLLGSNEKLEFDVIVRNLGEDSFESTFDMHLPEGINFNKIAQVEKTEVRILCSASENNTIKCDIGNPLPANKIARFRVLMDTAHHKEGMRPSYDFLMMVNSTNPEEGNTVADNRIEKRIPIWVNAKLELSGTSKPSEIYYNTAHFTSEKIKNESDIGPQVIHLYSIKNYGPSTINEAEVLFLWPYATLNGDDLLYLLEQPHTLGNMKCQVAEANYKDYELDGRKKNIWESLGISRSEFAGLTQPGGLVIFEGPGSHGSTPKDIKHSINIDDKSMTQEERARQSGVDSSSSNTIVHVAEDTGTGSKVSKIHVTSSNATYSSKATSGGGYSAHGSQSSYGSQGAGTMHSSSSSSGQGGFSSSGSSSSGSSSSGSSSSGSSSSRTSSSGSSSYGSSGSGSSSFGSSSSGSSSSGSSSSGSSSSGSDNRSKLVYTSTGNKFSESGISLSSGSSSASGSGMNVASSGSGNIDNGVYVEGRRSGQVFNQSDGGHTNYESGTYRLNKTHGHVNEPFVWDEDTSRTHSTIGRPNANSADFYEKRRIAEEQRLKIEENRRQEEEHRRGEETRRLEEEHRRVAETRRLEEEHRKVLETRRLEEEHRRVEETRRQEEGHTRQDGRTRQDEERLRHEERLRYEERRRLEEDRRTQIEEQQRQYNEQLEQRRREEEEQRRILEERRRQQTYSSGSSTAGGSTYHQTVSKGATDNFPYSEEEYTGSEENYQDLNRESHGSASYGQQYNRTQFSSSGHGSSASGHGSQVSHGAGGIASGQGFRTSTLDLGTLSGSSRSEGHNVGGGSYSQGAAHDAGARSGQSGGTHWESRSESSWSASGGGTATEFVGRDNVPTDRPNYQNRFHGRRKRDVETDKDISQFMQCQSTKCLAIRCTVGPLLKDQNALIALRSRVNVRTLRNISTSQSINFSSMMLARIDKLPYIGRPLNRTVHSHEIFTTVPAPEPDIKPDIVPLWVIVLSAVGGTIVLLLLIYALHKLGFFKRNRPTDAPERQPLRSNAYYNGDQQL